MLRTIHVERRATTGQQGALLAPVQTAMLCAVAAEAVDMQAQSDQQQQHMHLLLSRVQEDRCCAGVDVT